MIHGALHLHRIQPLGDCRCKFPFGTVDILHYIFQMLLPSRRASTSFLEEASSIFITRAGLVGVYSMNARLPPRLPVDHVIFSPNTKLLFLSVFLSHYYEFGRTEDPQLSIPCPFLFTVVWKCCACRGVEDCDRCRPNDSGCSECHHSFIVNVRTIFNRPRNPYYSYD